MTTPPRFLVVLCLLLACVFSVALAQARPPGKLLLNMLIKNEAENLRRTLPQWAKVIDYWIVGVDDANTDESSEIIKRYLGHLPGEIVIVHFDGMGPTWSQLVDVGIKNYPQATHGILADADYIPLQDTFDRSSLDARCPQYAFSILTQDHGLERNMDWIYRNLPGAKVLRRTHQSIQPPTMPNDPAAVAACSGSNYLIPLRIEGRSGGWGDRSGDKSERYIKYLELDLIDYPDDPRTLYYLGDSHLGAFERNMANPGPKDMEHLAKAVSWFERRSKVKGGHREETWWTTLKLGEIQERFYRNWEKALPYYEWCVREDPERADATFYIGQHYRINGDPARGFPFLLKAAGMPIPDRAVFNWHYLYKCLSKLELGRCAMSLSDSQMTLSQLKETHQLVASANCREADATSQAELKTLTSRLKSRVSDFSEANGGSSKGPGSHIKHGAVKKLVGLIDRNLDSLEGSLGDDVFDALVAHITVMREYLSANGKGQGAVKTCRKYRLATTPYLRFMKQNADAVGGEIEDSQLLSELTALTERVRNVCR